MSYVHYLFGGFDRPLSYLFRCVFDFFVHQSLEPYRFWFGFWFRHLLISSLARVFSLARFHYFWSNGYGLFIHMFLDISNLNCVAHAVIWIQKAHIDSYMAICDAVLFSVALTTCCIHLFLDNLCFWISPHSQMNNTRWRVHSTFEQHTYFTVLFLL